MTDLRAALTEACDLISNLPRSMGPGEARQLAADVVRLRSLADAPLTVLDALRDPEWRAGSAWIEARPYDNDHGKEVVFQLRWVGVDHVIQYRWGRSGTFTAWDVVPLDVSDLDAPCRLVPAEGDHA
jgi:hypothetical protein